MTKALWTALSLGSLLAGAVLLYDRTATLHQSLATTELRKDLLAIVVTGKPEPGYTLALIAFNQNYDPSPIAGPWSNEDRELSSQGVVPYNFSQHPRFYSTLSESRETHPEILKQYELVTAQG
jgi:hypothetical protein